MRAHNLIAVAMGFVFLSLTGCGLLTPSTPDKIVSIPAFQAQPSGQGQLQPAQDLFPLQITNPKFVTDLVSAAYDLDEAVKIGALPASDPAPVCLHDVLRKAGIEVPPGAVEAQSFKPKNDGPVSLGAIIYIQVQQAKVSVGRQITISPECEALLGRIQFDALVATAKKLPITSQILNLR